MKNKGITIVALVVTIVILMILVGVTIGTIFGDTGLFKRAQKAVNSYESATDQESKDISNLEKSMENILNRTDKKQEKIKVNPPKISEEGMIPIKYDEKKENWVITNEKDEEWYDYSEGKMKWANVMLSDGTYKKELKNYKEDGSTIVEEKDLGSMFVWIPRYAYSFNKYHTVSNQEEGKTQGITNVVFLSGTSNRDYENISYETIYDPASITAGEPTPMIVHPGFKFGEVNLTGIWVAKFEASMNRGEACTGNDDVTNKTLTVLPNVETWRYIKVGNAFINCYNMKNNGNVYGINENNIDTHLMKNIEWGVASYLSISQYGVVPTINSGVLVTESEGKRINHSYAGQKDYKTNKNQSTTGNITGIYDMCGSGWEYVAGYFDNLDDSLKNGLNVFKETNGKGIELDETYTKYWDKYEVDEEEKAVTLKGSVYRNYEIYDAGTEGNEARKRITDKKYNLMKNKLGDAMYEIIGMEYSYYGKMTVDSGTLKKGNYAWMTSTEGSRSYGTGYYNKDYAFIGNCNFPFMQRGGGWPRETGNGILGFQGFDGRTDSMISFRPVLII